MLTPSAPPPGQAEEDATAEELLGLASVHPEEPALAQVHQGEQVPSYEQAESSMAQSSTVSDAVAWQGLEAFMADIGLQKYTDVLKQQELTDPEALAHITDDDLKELNVTIGARRKLLAAVRRLQGS
jgi:hypothetical protein